MVPGACAFRHLRRCLLIVVALLATSVATLGTAATFIVNTPADFPDAVPGDGVCETVSGNGACTLRAALMEANALPGSDTVQVQANVTYLLTSMAAGEAGYALKINDDVMIEGGDRDTTVIDANSSVLHAGAVVVASCIGGGPCDGSHPYITASFSQLTLRDGDTVVGGGISISAGATVTLTDCVVQGNHASKYGGGIYNQGRLTLERCVVSGNSAATAPGGGGGLYSTSALVVRDSTVSGNHAVNGGGIGALQGTLAVVNSTISGNYADGYGGGINSAATTGLYNASVVANVANATGVNNGLGGGVSTGAGFTLANSLVSGNSLNDSILVADDCSGTLISQGNDIIESVDSTHCTLSGSFVIADPLVGPLKNNGGPTQTHALLPGSVAIDAGNAGGCTDSVGAILAADQRGATRPQGARCDIGAYESDTVFTDAFEG